ncbi:AraC family transcriptional regulator [Noviherbaspirillum cavernae]|uniref:AraC family transcriptional regulator n=1 Tax=Noviherbaspirillum cavernae TaxID=2320862 RepID=A0A418WZ99_9BURK|nr:AraC family transcriptional regulator [Noviherbaspirillum cavernae]RJG05405.1 AraC family transcriptional regulator [Noviherbaspirillum cavernae]
MSLRRSSLFLWHGRALVVGPGIDSTPHAHFAAQLTLALERPFRARLDVQQAWIETDAAIFAPNSAHQLDCGGGMLAHLFIELPLSIGSVLNAQYHCLQEFMPVREALAAAQQGRLDMDAAQLAAQQWIASALPDAAMPCGYDPRITRSLDWIAAHPGAPVSGELLASIVHLSESRFTHLFRQQTGLSLSRYLLWARLLDGVAAVARGESMTAAAHSAGFSDLAHMSRTFRGTFGVVPSELHKMTIAFKQTQ